MRLAGYMPDLAPTPGPTPNYRATPAGLALNPPPTTLHDLLGKEYGAVTVTARVAARAGRPGRWAYRCRCGATGEDTTYNLTVGNRRTCGRIPCRIALRNDERAAAQAAREAP